MSNFVIAMDAKEFERVYKKLLLPLGMYSLRMVMNVQESEDIVQTVFINTWNMIQAGNIPDNLRSYLYRAVRNASLKYLNAQERISWEEMDLAEDVSGEVIDTAERDARLWNAIEELPLKRREVFLMCKRDGYSYKEVSEAMGISIKTVENHLSKAMRELRMAYGLRDKSADISLSIFFLPLL